VELGLALDLFDFEAASEVSGTKFYYLENEAVLLELALINWTPSQLLSKGFVPLSTSDLVRSTVVEKCGFQPRGQNTQVYSVEGTDLCLAGTAEIPLGGMYMDSMLPEASLPLKLVAFFTLFSNRSWCCRCCNQVSPCLFHNSLELECPLAFFKQMHCLLYNTFSCHEFVVVGSMWG
jgi:seryl-tRNA synthetase